MFTLIPEEIDNYCEEHTSDESEILYRLNRETHLKVLRPRMLSGKLQGTFLAMISRLLKPKAILEIGTYTGYSALCLAEGLQSDGVLHTIEIEEELENIITKHFSQSPYDQQLTLHIGDANLLIDQLNLEWDLVFMDAEKKEYIQYYSKVLPKLKKGGFILVDNVLWSGKVVQDIAPNDHETIAITQFNHFVQNDSRVRNMILPFRDGMMLIEKL